MALQAPRGTRDILPDEAPYFQFLEATARAVFERYGYREIRTPMFESTELFVRGIGEETDIVSKEMYTFQDRKGRSLTLRPEGTAPVVRAMIEHELLKQQGAQPRVYYIGPMFRYERPQAGRQRQFNTAGVEFFGCASPLADAEVIAMVNTYLEALGFRGVKTKVNSIGNTASRLAYNAELRRLLAGIRDSLCTDCQRRAELNPLRVLDCKVPACQEHYKNFPALGDSLDAESRAHYDAVRAALGHLSVSYVETPGLVRGFDYYSHTVFETCLEGLGAQDAAAGGGRYDGLVEQLGGPATPAVGFGFGLERLAIAMQAAGIVPPGAAPSKETLYVLALEESCLAAAAQLAQSVRAAGRAVQFDLVPRGFKPGLRAANRTGCAMMAVIGGTELAESVVLIKDLAAQQERRIPLTEAAAELAPAGKP